MLTFPQQQHRPRRGPRLPAALLPEAILPRAAAAAAARDSGSSHGLQPWPQAQLVPVPRVQHDAELLKGRQELRGIHEAGAGELGRKTSNQD